MMQIGSASPDRSAWSSRRDLVLLASVCAVLFFARLGHLPLWDDDETRFASVAREMLRGGDWVVPRYNGELADKPPLLFWMIAGAFSLFGETAGAARLGPALLSVIAVLATWRIAARLYDRTVAVWGALALATSLLFVAEARLATTDAALLAFVALCLAVVVEFWWRGGSGWRAGRFAPERLGIGRASLVGVLAGLGVLTKGLAALVLPIMILWLFLWWMQPRSKGAWKDLRRGFSDGWRSLAALRPAVILAGAAAVAAPWHLLVWSRTGGEWLRLFYVQHYIGRIVWLQPYTGVAMQPPEGHRGFLLFQVVSLLGGLFPWSVFLPLAAWRTLCVAAPHGDGDPRHPAEKFLLVWLCVWLAAVSFSSTQLPHYVFPAFPAACIMVAALLVEGCRCPGGLRAGWLYAAAGGLVFGGLVIAGASAAAAEIFELPVFFQIAWLGGIPVLCAAAFAWAVKCGTRRVAMRIFAAGAIVLQAVVFLAGAPLVGQRNSIPAAVAEADRLAGGAARFATYRFSAPGLVWAAGRPVMRCSSAAQLAGFLRSDTRAFGIISAEAAVELAEVAGFEPRLMMAVRPMFSRHDVWLIGGSDAGDLAP